MTILEKVADHTLTLHLDTMSPEAVATGKNFFVDTFGCIIAGSHGRPSMLARQFCEDMYGTGKRTAAVIGHKTKLSSCSAAFINGISSHYHDYDDMLPTLSGHPSAAVLPCVLALCEELGKSGRDALEAYIIGVEVIDIMARGLNQKHMVHYGRGWHSTETIGIFGSAAAAGVLLGLTRDQLVVALSMAASEAAGLQGNFGTMTKAFHAGRAAEKGIEVAKLAKEGFTANPDIMEMEGGYVQASTGSLDTEAMCRRMDDRTSAFIDPGVTMKPYPCCKCCHNVIDDIWELMEGYGFKAEDVDHIHIDAQPLTMGCLKYHDPKTMLEGKFSAQYTVALTLVNGRRPGIRDFEGVDITDQRVIDMMHKIVMEKDDSIAGGKYFAGNWKTPMTVYLKDGRVLEKAVVHARGEAENPMTTDEVVEKLRECMEITMYPEKTEAVVRMLRDLEEVPSVADLMKAVDEASRPC